MYVWKSWQVAVDQLFKSGAPDGYVWVADWNLGEVTCLRYYDNGTVFYCIQN